VYSWVSKRLVFYRPPRENALRLRIRDLPVIVTIVLLAVMPLLFSPTSRHRAVKLKTAGAVTLSAAATADVSDRTIPRRASQIQAATVLLSTPTEEPLHVALPVALPGQIQFGSVGPAVSAFQSRLAQRGWHLAVDGIDGPQTTSVVRGFQQQHGLMVDGIGGPITWGALFVDDKDVTTDLPAPAPPPPPPPPVAATRAAVPRPVAAPAPVAAPVVSSGGLGGVWACIRQHESGGNYATNTGNGYYGAYQFSLPTWQSLGGVGLPSAASPAVQDAMAQKLQARSGWGQWPQTSKMCGV
jgi:peptidoglycan hydrolase-like protein with peptidoglycan-binding domain